MSYVLKGKFGSLANTILNVTFYEFIFLLVLINESKNSEKKNTFKLKLILKYL